MQIVMLKKCSDIFIVFKNYKKKSKEKLAVLLKEFERTMSKSMSNSKIIWKQKESRDNLALNMRPNKTELLNEQITLIEIVVKWFYANPIEVTYESAG